MERILRGIMRYRNTTREQMVREFQKVRDNPEVSVKAKCNMFNLSFVYIFLTKKKLVE